MKSVAKTSTAEKNLRLGITFLTLLFLILLTVKNLFPYKHIEDQNITDAHGLQIVNDLLPENSPLRRNEKRKIKYIIIHETGNPSSTADASSHSYYLQTGGDGSTAWHYTVDEHIAYHHIPDDEVVYHAGNGNKNGIGIELCINEGSNFESTFENGARLTASLIKAYGLSIKNVKQHADFMEKNCPENIRNNDRWLEFLLLTEKYLKEN